VKRKFQLNNGRFILIWVGVFDFMCMKMGNEFDLMLNWFETINQIKWRKKFYGGNNFSSNCQLLAQKNECLSLLFFVLFVVFFFLIFEWIINTIKIQVQWQNWVKVFIFDIGFIHRLFVIYIVVYVWSNTQSFFYHITDIKSSSSSDLVETYKMREINFLLASCFVHRQSNSSFLLKRLRFYIGYKFIVDNCILGSNFIKYCLFYMWKSVKIFALCPLQILLAYIYRYKMLKSIYGVLVKHTN
jgi:hypothetical protein